MFLPFSTALGLGKVPWITLTLVVLCTLIYWQQAQNRKLVNTHVQTYCSSNPEMLRSVFSLEDEDESLTLCREWLSVIHSHPNPTAFIQRLQDSPELSSESESSAVFAANLARLYRHFLQSEPPWSLDAALMYDPLGWNPYRTLTSSLSHASWSHLIGNMIFFIAFAPALEFLAGGRVRYIVILFATALAADIAYILTVFLGAEPLPTLGFSGVVMGMIGLSAFLMPNARIKVFYWWWFAVGTFYIPAWILALWYIGLDTWHTVSSADVGNVNVIAHVGGGFAGYLIGVLFLKKQRASNQDDLDDEMWYQRLKRQNWFGGSGWYRKRPETYANEVRLKQAKRDYQSFNDRLFCALRARKSSEAAAILLDYYDFYANSPETCEELFREMKDFGNSRAVQCAGRLVIFLYLRQGKIAAAFRVLEECLELSEHFALSSIVEAEQLLRYAQTYEKPLVAKQILSHAQWKYGAIHGATLLSMARQSNGQH